MDSKTYSSSSFHLINGLKKKLLTKMHIYIYSIVPPISSIFRSDGACPSYAAFKAPVQTYDFIGQGSSNHVVTCGIPLGTQVNIEENEIAGESGRRSTYFTLPAVSKFGEPLLLVPKKAAAYKVPVGAYVCCNNIERSFG